MFKGSIVALVTPFKEGKVDEERLKKLIEFHIARGTDAILACGTTGESATLSHSEHERVIEVALESAEGKIPIIAGTGSNSTQEAIALTKFAEAKGAAGALLITPYYNKPTQEGLYQHFKKVASEVSLPIILYNVPSRTGVNLLPETLARLSEVENIVGIKEAIMDITQIWRIVELCGEKITLLSGNDSMTFPILCLGGKGVISVVANIVPEKMKALIETFNKGKLHEARELHYQLLPLCEAMFYETNPIPVKTALSLMGLIEFEVRLPLWKMKESNLEKLKQVLKSYSLL
jgi:4-hydroxy-tetrahydrodipicolinate synthase